MNSQWQHHPQWNGKFYWVNALFLILTPLLSALALPWYLLHFGFSFWDLSIFFFMALATGLSITAGYHRLFSHQTYEANALTKFLYLFFGAGAFQNSALKWSSDHRYHHRFVDKEGDPYAITKGFFHAHMGWIFFNDPEERSFDNAKDLLADPMVQWQAKYYLLLSVLAGFILPALIGLAVGRPLAGFLWGGLFRVVWVHHGTFLINSLAHVAGSQPYSRKNTARDNWWLAFLTNGEGYHNFHHAFANDYRNGIRWYHWDPSKWLIASLHALGFCRNLRRTPESHILKARLEATVETLPTKLPDSLELMRANLELRIQDFQKRLRDFQAWKESRSQASARWRKLRLRYGKKRLRMEKQLLERSLREFRFLLQQSPQFS